MKYGTSNMAQNELVMELLELKGWKELQEPQKLAVDKGLLDSKDNFIIISPTATGKTFTAELAMYQALKNGGKVLYLVPSLSLVKEKVDDFQYLAKIGYIICSTKDDNAWDISDILVLTFESFFINILLSHVKIQRFSLAVFDEFHLLYDHLRGFNLEKSIVLANEFSLRIVCLSATFEDKKEIADWLKAKLVIVPETMRKVKLKEEVINTERIRAKDKNKAIYKLLIEKDESPCLIFCSTKPHTISRAKEITEYIKSIYPEITPKHPDFDFDNIKSHLIKIKNDKELTENEIELCKCLSYQVGFHNALLDEGTANFVTERLLSDKIKWLFTTTTLAYGLNSPTKSVVVFDNTFYDPYVGHTIPLPVYVYIQMIGRAGRKQSGEKNGYAYIVAGSSGEATRFEKDYFGRNLERAKSHLSFNDYAQKAILQLIFADRNQGTDIIKFFDKSLNSFQARKNPLETYKPIEILKKHMLELIEFGFAEDVGGGGYRLSSLGKITVEFISFHNKPYPLKSFKLMYEYTKEKGLNASFGAIYYICKFLDVRVSKKSRTTKEEICTFYSKIKITSAGNNEIAAYAIWKGWIENKTTREIESMCDIYADGLKTIASEVADGMWVLEKMYEGMGKNPSIEFIKLKNRVKHGVKDKEVEVVSYKGLGRSYAKDLMSTACNIIGAERGMVFPPTDIPNNDLIDFYVEQYKKDGRENLKKKLINMSIYFREKRAENFLTLIDRRIQES